MDAYSEYNEGVGNQPPPSPQSQPNPDQQHPHNVPTPTPNPRVATRQHSVHETERARVVKKLTLQDPGFKGLEDIDLHPPREDRCHYPRRDIEDGRTRHRNNTIRSRTRSYSPTWGYRSSTGSRSPSTNMKYDGSSDPQEHINAFEARINPNSSGL
ncbi:hypothetical protein PIB30_095365 [Stylosanthes scabra]|uniref:Reverse transcriptase domain-containing protein n=1 Tax=Stylosanthes scabra TaxID=79078 RepID=A0ABU6RW16_9FABA|nr:hypothetical protein [Stylosanthes scabra]